MALAPASFFRIGKGVLVECVMVSGYNSAGESSPRIRPICRTNTSRHRRIVTGALPLHLLILSCSSILLFPELLEKSEVGLAKSSNVGKDRRKVCVTDSKPGSEGCAVLIHCRGWYPTPARIASLIRIVRTIRGKCRENSTVRARHAIEVAAPDGTAHDEVVSPQA